MSVLLFVGQMVGKGLSASTKRKCHDVRDRYAGQASPYGGGKEVD
jgi:hypothetical protein